VHFEAIAKGKFAPAQELRVRTPGGGGGELTKNHRADRFKEMERVRGGGSDRRGARGERRSEKGMIAEGNMWGN